MDECVGKGDICSDAEACGRGELLQEVLQQGIVAVGGFYEDLSLMQGGGVFFAASYGCAAFVGFCREISPEGETLAVQAGSHEREHEGRRADQRHYGDAVPVAESHQ